MEQLRVKDRGLFNDLVYDHFKRLERETEHWDLEKASLESTIETKNNAISTRDKKIRTLENNLKIMQQELEDLKNAELSRRRRTLQAANDRSLENKENIPEKAPVRPLGTLWKEVSPPATTPPLIPTRSASSDDGEEGRSNIDDGMQTKPLADGLLEEMEDIKAKYEFVLKERDAYKGALDKLKAKYYKDKRAWDQWVDADNRRRASADKRTRDGTVMGRPRSASRRPFDAPQSPPRPPTVSPIKRDGLLKLDIDIDTPVRKGGLFSQLQPPIPVRASSFSGSLGSEWENARRSLPPSEGDPIPSDPPESAKIPGAPELPMPKSHAPVTPSRTTTRSNADDEFDPTSEAESDDKREGSATPRTRVLPPPKPEHDDGGGSKSSPVIIKSEPTSDASQGLGYYVFENESLDLDDAGEPPLKQRRIGKSQKERVRPNEPKMGNRKKEPEKTPAPSIAFAERHDGNVPMLPGIRRNRDTPSGIRTDSQLARPSTPPGMPAVDIPSTRVRYEPEDLADVLPPWRNLSAMLKRTEEPDFPRSSSRANQSPDKPRNPLPTPASNRKSFRRRSPVLKSTAQRPRKGYGDITPQVLEDGTEDGTSQPIRKGRRGPPDIVSNVDISELLHTPASKNPSLRPLARETIPAGSSVPAKRRAAWGSDGFETPSSSVNQRQAKTDPPIPGKNSADLDAPRQKTAKPATSISDFKINPDMNQGKDYAFHEVVRNKEQRKCLPGCKRACCKDLSKFVDAAGVPAKPKGPRWRSSSPAAPESETQERENREREFLEKHGRHRQAFPRRVSPPGFWDSEFPTTQQLKEQHAEADRIQQEKVKELEREAQKGKKGRYTYR